MSIAPVVKSVTVKASPERAFELFTGQMARWWPATHKIGKAPFVAIVIEPRAGGRWYERDAGGVECDWGKVLAWEPPSRLLLGWQLDSRFAYNPDLVTEVELTFAPAAAGGESEGEFDLGQKVRVIREAAVELPAEQEACRRLPD